MKRNYSLRLQLYLQSAIPGILVIALMVLGGTNFQISGVSEFIPSFAIIAIFFWTIYAPRFMPQWLCFLLGLFQDALNGMVLGESAVVNLILWGIVHSQRRFLIKENFSILYGIFIIASLACAIISWMIFSVVELKASFSIAIFVQWFFTIAFYPLMHYIFSQIYLVIIRNFRYIGWR